MKKFLFIITLLISALGLNAQSAGDETAINCGSYYLKFSITSEEPAKCRLFGYAGAPVDVTIPSTVTFSGKEFAVTSIGGDAFYGCSSLTSIEFGENSLLTSIGGYAFSYCDNLTNIELPSSVTSIGNYVFSYCDNLTNIELPSSVTSIGNYVFNECSSLTSIEIPSSVTSIGDNAFYACSSLTSIVVESGNTVYDSRNDCNAIIEIATNTLITGCQNTVIPNTVSFIGDYAFSGCSSLTSIEFGENSLLTSIGGYAFYNCDNLTSIEIPSGVTSIGTMAFSDCDNLTSIEIPSGVTSIGTMAFSDCYSLTKIYCYAENVPETEDFGWTHENMVIYVPAQSLDAYKAASPWNNYPIFPLGTEGPAAPKNLTAQVLGYNDEINLSWDAVEGAEYYNVYMFDELYEQTSNVNTTIYGLSSNTEYCFKVTAVNVISESEKSEEACVETEPMVPAAPQNIVATAISTSSIIITWDNTENAQNYNVYRNEELITSTSNPHYTDTDLEYNTYYCYTITATYADTESAKSEEVCIKTLGEGVEELISSFNIYPNPVSDKLYIETQTLTQTLTVEIYDVYGRQQSMVNGQQSTVIDVTSLNSGIYFVMIKTNEGVVTKRFIKN